jgi:hypothetical protein
MLSMLITDAFALQLPTADALEQVQDGVNAIITANKEGDGAVPPVSPGYS